MEDRFCPGEEALDSVTSENQWCALDVETTGLHPERGDRVLEVGVWSEVYGVWHTLVNPSVSISDAVIDVHGIDGHLLANAPHFSDIAEELASLLEGQVIVGHNVVFDLRFLHFEFARIGKPLPTLEFVDNISLGERAGFKRARLDHFAASLGVTPVGGAHRAGRDALVAGQCARSLLELLDVSNIMELPRTVFACSDRPVRGLI